MQAPFYWGCVLVARPLSSPEIESRLTEAKARLSSYGKGDGGYHDAWSEQKALVERGSQEDFDRWAEGNKARKERIGFSVCVLSDPVKDETGAWRWAGLVRASADKEPGIRPSGFGEIADTALLVLQFAWTIDRCGD